MINYVNIIERTYIKSNKNDYKRVPVDGRYRMTSWDVNFCQTRKLLMTLIFKLLFINFLIILHELHA